METHKMLGNSSTRCIVLNDSKLLEYPLILDIPDIVYGKGSFGITVAKMMEVFEKEFLLLEDAYIQACGELTKLAIRNEELEELEVQRNRSIDALTQEIEMLKDAIKSINKSNGAHGVKDFG